MSKFNNKPRQQGFTLVEVIVVAIIVAALAAVAIPMYTSYVKSSRSNAAANAAGSIASYLGSCRNSQGTIDATLAEGTWTDGLAADTLNCTIVRAGETDTLSTLNIPVGVMVTISSLTGAGEVLTAHIDGSDTARYAY